MPFVLCYTKSGIGTYPDHNYPGHIAYVCDWEQSLHLAVSHDGIHFEPLRNNTGILFPKCSYQDGNPKGTTKTLISPWLLRDKDGSFLLCAVRKNENAPDPQTTGKMMLFRSKDLVRYDEIGFVTLSEEEVKAPRCVWEPEKKAYYIEWENSADETYRAWSQDLNRVYGKAPCHAQMKRVSSYDIPGCIPGNMIEISDEKARTLQSYLGVIRNTGVEPITARFPVGTPRNKMDLPGAVCIYSDGSSHRKKVDWDQGALDCIDPSVPGVYEITGTVRMHDWKFPMQLNYGAVNPDDVCDPNVHCGMSDPCVTFLRGRYYLTSTGIQNIAVRCADTLEGVFSAEPIIVYRVPLEDGQRFSGTWAAELHEIDDVIYLFTTVCPGGEWTKVKSCVLRCRGDICNPDDWEAPVFCQKKDGSLLTEGGISLDMTWFRDGGRDYVMWSDRKIQYGTEPLVIEPADIYIGTVDPSAPWRLTSAPVCVTRPSYGWDRYETEVLEGPYLLRHGNDLFVTVSGSSTGMTDLYDVGLLHATSGADLLNPDHWTMWPYPFLTKESVPGEYGPGHNNFVKDQESGDEIMVYHAVPHDENDRSLNRQPGLRRVHWAKTGLPYLEMTPERDVAPEYRTVTMKLRIE